MKMHTDKKTLISKLNIINISTTFFALIHCISILFVGLFCFLSLAFPSSLYASNYGPEDLTQMISRLMGPDITENLSGDYWQGDLGVSFLHNDGKVYILIGDTLGANIFSPNAIGSMPYQDFVNNPTSLEWKTDAAENPLSFYPLIEPDSTVPGGAISLNGTMYIFMQDITHWANWNPGEDPVTHGRCVLIKSTDSGQTFSTVWTGEEDNKFVNIAPIISAHPTDPTRQVVYMISSGQYRNSPIYLAYSEIDQIENQGSYTYFAGIIDGIPQWSNTESQAMPIIPNVKVGELSVQWNNYLNKWLLSYFDFNEGDQANMYFRSAPQPWGPWSGPKFVYSGTHQYSWYQEEPNFHQGGTMPWNGEYGGYLLPPEVNHDQYAYFNLSLWIPYSTFLMRADLEKIFEPQAAGSLNPPGKTLPIWPTPTKLLVVTMDPDNKYQIMTLAALEGLVNRTAPQGVMIYLEMDTFPDQSWREYYVDRLGLDIEYKTFEEILAWVRANTNIQHYIVIDPYTDADINLSRSSTINIASTMAGIVGNAVPIHSDDIATLETYGYNILPDSYTTTFGAGGTELYTPNAFDLRNQWQSLNPGAPWATRENAYRWALDYLLPLCDHHAIILQPENDYANSWFGFTPWTFDYSIGTKIFHFDFNPDPNPNEPQGSHPPPDPPLPEYDYPLYQELLQTSGPFTMLRGWAGYSEGDNIGLISQYHCFHAGSNQMANPSVHMALSNSFDGTFSQREVTPDEVTLDPNKIYLTFSITDGDQFGVLYRYYQHYNQYGVPEPLWLDPARGQIPINWTMSALMYQYGRGIMRYLFDTAYPDKDYFTADLPVGYAHFTYNNFGEDLDDYENFANSYLPISGMSVADFLLISPLMSDQTVETHVQGLTNAIAVREGYGGTGSYQGIYWPETRPTTPYILNVSIVDSLATSPAQKIADIVNNLPFQNSTLTWRPIFMHLTWQNWGTTPSDMLNCINELNNLFPGQYELVGMPEFVALAQKAKLTGLYPIEFYTGSGGQELPYLWEDRETTTNLPRNGEFTPWRATTGNNSVTYKFNIYPSQEATLTVDIEGADYRVDASSDNLSWAQGIISGQNLTPVTVQADLTPYLNASGSVYVRVAGESKIWRVKVDYTPQENEPPVLDPLAPNTFTINEGENLNIQLTATSSYPTHPLSFSYSSIPLIAANAQINSSTGLFTFNPDYNQANTYNITFRVTDQTTLLYAEQPATINVIDVPPPANDPPSFINPPGPQTVNEGDLLTFTINATDPESDPLTYSASNLPTGATFDPSSREFSWTPDYTQSGDYTVTFSVTDNHNPPVTLPVEITVIDTSLPPNTQPPVLDPVLPNYTVNQTETLNIQLLATDPNSGDTLTFSYSSTPAIPNAQIDPVTGLFTFTPPAPASDLYQVTFRVTDQTLLYDQAYSTIIQSQTPDEEFLLLRRVALALVEDYVCGLYSDDRELYEGTIRDAEMLYRSNPGQNVQAAIDILLEVIYGGPGIGGLVNFQDKFFIYITSDGPVLFQSPEAIPLRQWERGCMPVLICNETPQPLTISINSPSSIEYYVSPQNDISVLPGTAGSYPQTAPYAASVVPVVDVLPLSAGTHSVPIEIHINEISQVINVSFDVDVSELAPGVNSYPYLPSLVLDGNDFTASLVTVDLDNDGDLDIYCGNYGYPQPAQNTIYRNTGSGNFIYEILADLNPKGTRDVALADLDMNGTLDSIIDGNLNVAIGDGQNIIRSFNDLNNPAVLNQDAFDTSKVVVDDINGDGIDELILCNADNRVQVFAMSTPGSFDTNPAWESSRTYGSMALGDVDGDGVKDLALSTSGAIKICKGYANLSFDENMSSWEEYLWHTEPEEKFINIIQLLFSDFNNDGEEDFIVVADKVAVYRNIPNGLNRTLDPAGSPWWTLELPYQMPSCAAIGYINEDNYKDMAIGFYPAFDVHQSPNERLLAGENKVYLGKDDGGITFENAPAWVAFYSDKTTDIALADFNSDGHLDLVVGNDGEKYIYYNLAGSVQPPTLPANPSAFYRGNIHSKITITEHVPDPHFELPQDASETIGVGSSGISGASSYDYEILKEEFEYTGAKVAGFWAGVGSPFEGMFYFNTWDTLISAAKDGGARDIMLFNPGWGSGWDNASVNIKFIDNLDTYAWFVRQFSERYGPSGLLSTAKGWDPTSYKVLYGTSNEPENELNQTSEVYARKQEILFNVVKDYDPNIIVTTANHGFPEAESQVLNYVAQAIGLGAYDKFDLLRIQTYYVGLCKNGMALDNQNFFFDEFYTPDFPIGWGMGMIANLRIMLSNPPWNTDDYDICAGEGNANGGQVTEYYNGQEPPVSDIPYMSQSQLAIEATGGFLRNIANGVQYIATNDPFSLPAPKLAGKTLIDTLKGYQYAGVIGVPETPNDNKVIVYKFQNNDDGSYLYAVRAHPGYDDQQYPDPYSFIPQTITLDLSAQDSNAVAINMFCGQEFTGDDVIAITYPLPELAEDRWVQVYDVQHGQFNSEDVIDSVVNGVVTATLPNYDYYFIKEGLVNSNAAPILSHITENYTIFEGNALDIQLNAIDPNQLDVLTFSYTPEITNAQINPASGLFTFHPNEGQAGDYNITFTVTDQGGLSDIQEVSILVRHINYNAPVLNNIDGQQVDEGQPLTIQLVATDPDPGDTLTFSYSSNPPITNNVQLDPATGLFTFSPDYAQSGNYLVTFTVTDSYGLYDWQDVNMEVININQAPLLNSIADQYVNANELLQFTISATDPDEGDTLTFTGSDYPFDHGATLTNNNDRTATFSWTPAEADGGPHQTTFSVSDGQLSDYTQITITVGVSAPPQNNPPVLYPLPPVIIMVVNQQLNIALLATDPDGDTVTYYADNLPANATLNELTGAFSWVPPQPVAYDITFYALDEHNLSSNLVPVQIQVGTGSQPPTEPKNLAPILDPLNVLPDSFTVNEGELLSFTLTAYDPNGDPVTYGFNNTLPEGATLDQSSGIFSWTPSNTQGENYTLSFYALDNQNAYSNIVTVQISVLDTQYPFITTPPQLVSILTPQTIQEGQTLTIALSANNPYPEHSLIFSFTSLQPIANAQITQPNNNPTEFTFSPDFTQANTYNLTFRVTDGVSSLYTEQGVDIIVSNLNRTPILNNINNQTVPEGQVLNVALGATDPDLGDTLTFSYSSLPPITNNVQLNQLNNNAAEFIFSPDYTQANTYRVTFRVTDQLGAFAEQEVVVEVTDVNQLPSLIVPDYSVTIAHPLNFVVVGSDPDNDNLTYSATNLPSGAILTREGAFSWLPIAGQKGPHRVTFRVTDEHGAFAEDDSTITVNPNPPPVLNAIPTPQTISIGETLSFTALATDPDNDILVYSAADLPLGATFSPEGIFSWTPNVNQGGITYTVNIIVTDRLGAEDSQLVSIVVDDTPPSLPSLSVTDLQQSEGNSGMTSFIFTVALSQASSQMVTVHYSTSDGTATAGSDYLAVTDTLITFIPGQTSQNITIAVIGDNNIESNESFFINLTNAANATINDSQGQGVILNDDQQNDDNIALGKHYTLSRQPSALYPDNNYELTNGLYAGNNNHLNSNWVGWVTPTGQDQSIVVTIDLAGSFNINRVSLSCLGGGGQEHIWTPQSVEVLTSTNGADYSIATNIPGPVLQGWSATLLLDLLEGQFGQRSATHIKFIIHPYPNGLGNDFTFIDEIKVFAYSTPFANGTEAFPWQTGQVNPGLVALLPAYTVTATTSQGFLDSSGENKIVTPSTSSNSANNTPKQQVFHPNPVINTPPMQQTYYEDSAPAYTTPPAEQVRRYIPASTGSTYIPNQSIAEKQNNIPEPVIEKQPEEIKIANADKKQHPPKPVTTVMVTLGLMAVSMLGWGIKLILQWLLSIHIF